ncbi:hypothetical protein BpHYR1_030432 [Brachionus plicatilis]|uniref:Uncharacterized protein n=1 Tax=Brachionus plicatilis TaxID=10195 RepID=A0A3M7SWX2_BRAPC|nr:hypothetical protein BpHYR1_030432 [Brachionus plicatilis]
MVNLVKNFKLGLAARLVYKVSDVYKDFEKSGHTDRRQTRPSPLNNDLVIEEVETTTQSDQVQRLPKEVPIKYQIHTHRGNCKMEKKRIWLHLLQIWISNADT